MRLSIDTIWELHNGGDEDAIELLHDHSFYGMMEEERYCFSWIPLTSDEITCIPLKEYEKMEKKSKTVDTEMVVTKKNSGSMVSDVIDLVVKNLRAAQAWIKFVAKRNN